MNTPQRVLVALALLILTNVANGALNSQKRKLISPYETAESVAITEIDRIVSKQLQTLDMELAPQCSDEVFVRRVYIDVTGTLPEPKAALEFARDKRHNKRARLIDELLESNNYATYWALKWCDLLRVKSEFPVNLWPNAVQAYHRWVYDAIRTNKPYNVLARELLTSSGSNFREPAVNFWRSAQGKDASALASIVALTFMGTRLDSWPDEKRAQLEAFFKHVAFKPTSEWKEEIVHLDPAHYASMRLVPPVGNPIYLKPGEDPRLAFADWLIQPENPWFARAIINRQWAWLMSRGIVHEPDDIQPDNPPVNSVLLAYLERELASSDYDLKHTFRLILNSRTYQQSSIPWVDSPEATIHFACYPIRRMDAEVLIDAICMLTNTHESYSSMIPEPFTFVPEEHRTIMLPDGSITSSFLELFGRPARDTGYFTERNNTASDKQCLHLLNSSHIQNKINRCWRTTIFTRGKEEKQIESYRWSIYMALLSRYPTQQEQQTALAYVNSSKVSRTQAGQDILWSVLNSKEFLFNH